MKKLIIFLLVLLMFSLIYAADNQRIQVRNWANKYQGTVHWYKANRSGSTVYFDEVDTCLVAGASDTLYSDLMYNPGRISAQFMVRGGTTVSLRIEIQTANSGFYSGSWETIPDAAFKTMYYVATGSTPDSQYVSFDSFTWTSADTTTCMTVPLQNAEVFRFAVFSTSSQSGNSTVEIPIFLINRNKRN